MNFNALWFGLVGVLLFGYAVLDGFDLGVGILHPFVGRDDREKRLVLNSIGPLWDGNEVWLVVFGGALFACFPDAYATIFSGFYMAFMLLLCAIIFRAISIEFRSKRPSARWRRFFDGLFFLSSLTAALLFGVAIGNVLMGLPVGADKEFRGSFWTLIRPYPLLLGVMVVTLFALHGAIYLHLKTEGDLQARLKTVSWRAWGLFLTVFVFATVYTLVALPRVTENFRTVPLAWVIPVLMVLAVANIGRALYQEKAFAAFVSSCCTIAGLVFLLGIALFPNLLPSSLNPDWSLTIYNAASSQKTLRTAAIIALIGMPLVLVYTGIVYWVFRGKVKLGEFSY